MVRVGICDDELIITSRIEQLLENISGQKHLELDIDIYSDGEMLCKSIKLGYRFDIIYLDIEMKKVNGIEAAKRIRKIDRDVIIIYISSYESYLIELFEVEPFRFIKKPIDEKKFFLYFEKAYEKLLNEDVYFEYKYNKTIAKVLIQNIIYFESKGRVIHLVKKDSVERFYGKLSEIEKQLKGSKLSFLRIHQSYLINFKYIEKMAYTKVYLNNEEILQISEDRQKEIRKEYGQILGGTYIDI